jgi:outer membrane receptor for monomeric catechols
MTGLDSSPYIKKENKLKMSTFYGSLNSNYIKTANEKLRLQTEHNTYENIDLRNTLSIN